MAQTKQVVQRQRQVTLMAKCNEVFLQFGGLFHLKDQQGRKLVRSAHCSKIRKKKIREITFHKKIGKICFFFFHRTVPETEV